MMNDVNPYNEYMKNAKEKKRQNNKKKKTTYCLKEITERKVNSIAYIEVKKNAESKPRSDDNEIMEYAIRDRDYLKRQLDIIDPQIIFLGGTKKCYDLIEEQSTSFIACIRVIIDSSLIFIILALLWRSMHSYITCQTIFTVTR